MSSVGFEERMIATMQIAAASSVAGGLIAAAGRPFSLEEALKLVHDVHMTMFPSLAGGWRGAEQNLVDKKVPIT